MRIDSVLVDRDINLQRCFHSLHDNQIWLSRARQLNAQDVIAESLLIPVNAHGLSCGIVDLWEVVQISCRSFEAFELEPLILRTCDISDDRDIGGSGRASSEAHLRCETCAEGVAGREFGIADSF